jgi:hypothetical protein
MHPSATKSSVAQRLRDHSWDQDWPRLESGEPPKAWEVSWYRPCGQSLRDEPHAFTTVANAHRMLDALERAASKISETLAYPATWKSWAASAHALVLDPEYFQEAAALAGMYGPSLRRALASTPDASRPLWLRQHNDTENKITPREVAPTPDKNKEDVHAVDEFNDDQPAVKEANPPALKMQHDEPLEWVSTVLETIRGMPHAQRQEVLDGKIKDQVRAEKGSGADTEGYWWKDVLFPALARAEPDQVAALAAAWPAHHKVVVESPSRWFDGRFWSIIGSAVKPTREALLQEAIPQMLDTSGWDDRTYSKALEVIMERARDLKGLFEQRLRLWTSLGGTMSRPMVPERVEASAFAPPPPSVEEWIRGQEIPEWSSALDRINARTQRRPGP